MIPKWQQVAIAALLLLAVVTAIYTSPNSYAHMFLAGRCFGQPIPEICVRHSRYW